MLLPPSTRHVEFTVPPRHTVPTRTTRSSALCTLALDITCTHINCRRDTANEHGLPSRMACPIRSKRRGVGPSTNGVAGNISHANSGPEQRSETLCYAMTKPIALGCSHMLLDNFFGDLPLCKRLALSNIHELRVTGWFSTNDDSTKLLLVWKSTPPLRAGQPSGRTARLLGTEPPPPH